MNLAEKSAVYIGATIAAACVVAIVAVLLVLEWSLDLRWLRAPLTAFTVSGTTTDEQGKPVAGARVIVAVSERGTLKAVHHCYGVEADGQGEFSFSREAPFALSAQMQANACAPDGRMGVAARSAKQAGEQYVVNLHVVVSSPPGNGPNQAYDGFQSYCGSDIEFIDHNWLSAP